ncbi:MAG: hypothetical protein LIP03_00615 [Bacteroidales bacterium]|nr:hypothetical protein [Bacteroidales bacterium]
MNPFLKRALLSKPGEENVLKRLQDIWSSLKPYEDVDALKSDLDKLDRILGEDKEANGQDQTDPITWGDVKDCRIRYLAVKNFRRFPSDSSFGLSFEINGAIQSLYLIGENGIGKSSLYNAIEYYFLGDCGEAKYRKIEDTIEYVTHKNQTPSGHEIKINPENIKKELAGMPLAPFFTTENDLQEMIHYMPEPVSADWIPFFTHCIGLQELNELIDALDGIKFLLPKTDCLTSFDKALEDNSKGLSKMMALWMGLLEPKTKQAWDKLIDRGLTKINKIKKLNNSPKFDLSMVEKEVKELDKIISEPSVKPYLGGKYAILFDELHSSYSKLVEALTPEKTTAEDETKKLSSVVEGGLPLQPKIGLALGDLRLRIEELQADIQSEAEAVGKYQKDSKFDWNQFLKSISNEFTESRKIKETADSLKEDSLAKTISLLRQKRFDYIKKLLGEDFQKMHKEFFKDGDFFQPYEVENFSYPDDKAIQFNLLVSENTGRSNPNNPGLPNSFPIYLNTFRLKLFAIATRCLLAIKLMKDYRISFPLVFDDVFYASDYENRDRLRVFFTTLYKYYRDVMGADAIPLQVIFLTHDEQILSIARRALQSTDNVTFGRLYDHAQARRIPDNPKHIDNETFFYNVFFSFNY